MDDKEAEKQIQQMVNFILNEAKETAENLTQKANEDFNIEKLKLVQQMKERVRQDIAKRKKAEETQKAIMKSSAINRARLKKIEARQWCIEALRDNVGERLQETSKSEQKYKQIIADLIVQGALKLMEDEISVKCRAADANLVRSCLDAASSNYGNLVKKVSGSSAKLKLSLHKENLAPTCLGGVVLFCRGGTISVDNTLDTRLQLLMDNDRPALRNMLFPSK